MISLTDAENLNLIWNIGTKSFSANYWNLNNTRQDLSAASDWLISNITELKGWSGLSGVTSMEGMLKGQKQAGESIHHRSKYAKP